MNCPSRTDDTLLHDGWNQNPRLLSPDLTTRQDLNGISNTRENKDDDSGPGTLGGSSNWKGIPPLEEKDAGNYLSPGCEASLTMSGRLAPQNTHVGIGHTGLNPNKDVFPSYQSIKDWALWLLSVLLVSAVISFGSLKQYFTSKQPLILEAPATQQYTEPVKRSSCAQGGTRGAYDLPLHVAALFIILATSSIACAFPILATRFPRMHIPPAFLFFVTHFGTGVLIATAFVHLLPTAFTSLGDPCLSNFWTKDYPAMPGAIALGGIFLVTVIEMVFSPAQSICRGGNQVPAEKPASRTAAPIPTLDVPAYPKHTRVPISHAARMDGRSHLRDMGPLIGRSASISRAINRMGEGTEDIVRVSSAPDIRTHHEKDNGAIETDVERHDDTFALTPEQKQKKETMQVYLLEMGILFHSVFIGMSLSVSVGSEFVILLIAIVFHQTFEGLALGSRIASLPWSEKQLQPWIMSLAYGCTTPIGQAIGLATHTLYSPDSEVGLLVVGVMNAISAGLLIFASLVELMSEDFLSDESWRILRGKRRVYACILVFLGAFCMSIVGAWA
ncbi:Zinc/iron permease [Penicillium expansum]|uniref:Zinc/iron permease n=1 Tax=Penicillium expansum TaxID=27334 RepID=A0A0A2JI48_PENEN|nr:Zinc/iron permease [Penicillium expansum]KGO42932.1 Zinc/iron permease [Penicillium expansum]KGO55039.1 Zinc/iron permease [Penicillium expansum]KGO57053.1 Zinc/iron permease [Penicillium expansum]